jgi:prepilin-type N-terminal cleavage/methylation domain-containing protein
MKSRQGLTLIELMVAIGIFVGVVAFAIPSISKLEQSRAEVPSEVVQSFLTSAANRARAGVNGSSWGVYFPYDNGTRIANEIILFSGESYAARNTAYDLVYDFDDLALFTDASLSGGAPSTGDDHEAVFAVLSGATSDYGSLTLDYQNGTVVINLLPEGIAVIE